MLASYKADGGIDTFSQRSLSEKSWQELKENKIL
jgi:hypothetical protein